MAAKKQLEKNVRGSDSGEAIESTELDFIFFGDSGESYSHHKSEDSDCVP